MTNICLYKGDSQAHAENVLEVTDEMFVARRHFWHTVSLSLCNGVCGNKALCTVLNGMHL